MVLSGIEDAITGAKSLGEALSGVLKSIGGTLLDLQSPALLAVLTLVVVVVAPKSDWVLTFSPKVVMPQVLLTLSSGKLDRSI